MANLQSWKKAYEALKDTTMLGLAENEYKDLDIAIVKATNHVESPPEEQHIREILAAITSDHPRADVAYCVHALARRLLKTSNWVVAVKTLIVIHRILRDGDPKFRDELLHYSLKAHILQIPNFNDDSSYLALDCSAWVRLYVLFLEERLECFRILRYDVEAEQLKKSSEGFGEGSSRTRSLDSQDLLEQLPALQKLLFCLICCQPEGEASGSYLIKYALSQVVKESFKIYCAINDGIINLVDLFFEMSKNEASKALDIYKRAIQQALNLAEFYEVCKGLELARNFNFPITKEPPRSLVPTMEEYIKEAPHVDTFSDMTLTEFTRQSIKSIEADDAHDSTVDLKLQMLKLQELEERIDIFEKGVMLHLRLLIAICLLVFICTAVV